MIKFTLGRRGGSACIFPVCTDTGCACYSSMHLNRGAIERRQIALYRAFAQLLQQRDEADGVCRLMQENEEFFEDIME